MFTGPRKVEKDFMERVRAREMNPVRGHRIPKNNRAKQRCQDTLYLMIANRLPENPFPNFMAMNGKRDLPPEYESRIPNKIWEFRQNKEYCVPTL